ncbi:Ig-like domain repeat protein [Nocardia sp. NPDC003345]
MSDRSSRKLRGAVAVLCGAAAVAVSPSAVADTGVAPVVRLDVLGEPATASAAAVPTGCSLMLEAQVTLPDGSPVEKGTVQFFNRLPGGGDVLLGEAPVRNGTATVLWTPEAIGSNGLTAGYSNGLPDILPISQGVQVTARPGPRLGTLCL